MRVIWIISLVLFSAYAYASSEKMTLPLDSGEEVSVNIYPATFASEDEVNSTLIWFTEGYADRRPFKHLITQFNDAGYEVWQIDLLESYFLERTPTNVRRMSGEGVAAVIAHAGEMGKSFVPISTGRMSLILLRGLRLWQMTQIAQMTQNEIDKNQLDNLKQVVLFFPNLFDAPQKAGDAPQLFPVVAASSLPITIVQPAEGTFKWKLPEIIDALETHNSQVTLAAVPKVRDWYFLRRDPSEIEKQAGLAIPTELEHWLKAGRVKKSQNFIPAQDVQEREVTVRDKGIVTIKQRLAPEFELTDINDKKIALADKRGKVILLNFWASWCPPCVKEIPSMNRLAESFDAADFEIVSVNFKESPSTIEKFLKEVQVDFPVLIDLDGKVSAKYEIFAFPSSFLIDKQGKMKYSVNSAIEWDTPEAKATIQEMIEMY